MGARKIVLLSTPILSAYFNFLMLFERTIPFPWKLTVTLRTLLDDAFTCRSQTSLNSCMCCIEEYLSLNMGGTHYLWYISSVSKARVTALTWAASHVTLRFVASTPIPQHTSRRGINSTTYRMCMEHSPKQCLEEAPNRGTALCLVAIDVPSDAF